MMQCFYAKDAKAFSKEAWGGENETLISIGVERSGKLIPD